MIPRAAQAVCPTAMAGTWRRLDLFEARAAEPPRGGIVFYSWPQIEFD